MFGNVWRESVIFFTDHNKASPFQIFDITSEIILKRGCISPVSLGNKSDFVADLARSRINHVGGGQIEGLGHDAVACR